MSKFKMILFGGAKENMGAVAAAKLEITRRLIFTCFVLTLACLAGFAYISKAWFASNKDVGAENASVTSESGTPNLFIRLQANKDEADPQYYSHIGTNWSSDTLKGHGLYPISTANCENWYYISDWTMVLSEETDGITTGEYYASEYTEASPSAAGIYTGYAGKERRAFYCSKYNLYSDKGALDVYLNPTDPIEVTFDEANQGLMEAIRIAVVENIDENTNRLVFVYAPVAESGTGKNFVNGSGTKAEPDTFYAVTGTNTAAIQSGILVDDAGLADYKAENVPGDDHSFTATDKTKICTADNAGANISVYIWLEGMDAQSVINVADNRTIGVNLNFVGVPVEETTPAQANGEG